MEARSFLFLHCLLMVVLVVVGKESEFLIKKDPFGLSMCTSIYLATQSVIYAVMTGKTDVIKFMVILISLKHFAILLFINYANHVQDCIEVRSPLLPFIHGLCCCCCCWLPDYPVYTLIVVVEQSLPLQPNTIIANGFSLGIKCVFSSAYWRKTRKNSHSYFSRNESHPPSSATQLWSVQRSCQAAQLLQLSECGLSGFPGWRIFKRVLVRLQKQPQPPPPPPTRLLLLLLFLILVLRGWPHKIR